MVIVNVIVWGFIFGLGVILNRKDLGLENAWNWCWQKVKWVWDWCWQKIKWVWDWCWQKIKWVWDSCNKKLKLWIKNPLLFYIIAAFIVTFIVFVLLFFWQLYPLIKSLYGLIPEDEFGDIEINSPAFRNISLLIAGSATFSFAVLGMFLSVIRNILTRHQNNISQQAQITESMGQAITQIGAFNGEKPNIVVRLGGLYSLQFIMQDSPRHEDSIVRIFYAYVRENAKKVEKGTIEETEKDLPRWQKKRYPREDVQVALDVINQFNKVWREKEKSILNDIQIDFSRANFSGHSFAGINFSNSILDGVDLSHATLAKVNFSHATLIDATLIEANLIKANLTKVNLSGADLTNADLTNADLTNADLIGADLTNTDLIGADLTGADLTGADLTGADLIGADLTNADLTGTNLTGANLHGADLFYAKNLKQDQVNKANGGEDTLLPKVQGQELEVPKDWKNSEYDELDDIDDIDDETWDAFEPDEEDGENEF